MLAAIGCWFVGSHLALPVPGVILYMLASVCLEEGWREILPTWPGRLMVLMAVLSTVSTVAWMTAGWQFFRVRSRRGWVHILVAIGSMILTAVTFAFL